MAFLGSTIMTRIGSGRGRFNDRVIPMARILDMHEKWMKEPEYRKAYEALEEEFALAAAVVNARTPEGVQHNGQQEYDQ
jgi:hypothetical protein